MNILIVKNDKNGIQAAAIALRAGKLAAIPTETVYGLAANALDEHAVVHIFEAKGRPADNPLIVHIADIDDMQKYAKINDAALRCAQTFWPGPFTMILPKRDCIPDIVSAGLDTVALRCPASKTARDIIRLSGCPLAAPSANISGKPSPTTAQHVYDDFADKIEVIVNGGACAFGIESTVVTLAVSPPVLLRPGAITPEQLRTVLPDIQIADAVLHELPENAKVLSPGLKHKHYAPKAKTTCVTGTTAAFTEYVTARAVPDTAVICFDEEAAQFSQLKTYPYGSEDHPEVMASKIFALLRQTDKDQIKRVFIHTKFSEDIGLAVYNRLLRACAFDIVDAEKKRAFIIGVTGPSGSGKGTFSKIAEEYGFLHIDTDQLARQVVPQTIDALRCAFGDDILSEDGSLDRNKLAQAAFSNEHNTKRLNEIMHPAIIARVKTMIAELTEKEQIGAVIDGAALIEAGALELCDMTVTVWAPREERLKRVQKRDNITEQQAQIRFHGQKDTAFYTEHTHYALCNTSYSQFKTETEALLQTHGFYIKEK